MSLTTKPFQHLKGAIDPAPPPLEAVPLHTQLARANSQHAKLTEQLRQLKADWASRNIRAQELRTPISTPEVTFVETRRRNLHLALEATQAEIGRVNREIKEKKAPPKASHRGSSHDVQAATRKPKRMPYADDPAFPVYFILAAKEELEPKLYAQVECLALSLIHHARCNGVEGSLQT